ncbi:hypothetical protein CYMTET_31306, partial [Cymbomonas tetramitiformis]
MRVTLNVLQISVEVRVTLASLPARRQVYPAHPQRGWECEGSTWAAYGAIVAPPGVQTNLLEGSVVELLTGAVLMLLRSNTGCLFESISMDKGKTWSMAAPSRLPNPNSKVHIMRIEPSGHLLLAFNNHKHTGARRGAECKSCRSDLELAVSEDDGHTWQRLGVLDNEAAPGIRLHYPTMVQAKDKLVIVYSRFYLYKDPGLYSEAQ